MSAPSGARDDHLGTDAVELLPELVVLEVALGLLLRLRLHLHAWILLQPMTSWTLDLHLLPDACASSDGLVVVVVVKLDVERGWKLGGVDLVHAQWCSHTCVNRTNTISHCEAWGVSKFEQLWLKNHQKLKYHRIAVYFYGPKFTNTASTRTLNF